MRLTIITPAFNSQDTIERLYESIITEAVEPITWLIADDGSTDNSAKLIQRFSETKLVNIEYYYKENGGKVSAHNLAFSHIKTEWFFAIDSDDWLAPGSLHLIQETLNKSQDNIDCYVFHRIDEQGVIIGTKFPAAEIANYNELFNRGIVGDKVHLQRTRILQHVNVRNFKDETYISMMQIFMQLSDKVKIHCVNKAITICRYLPSGLTKNIVQNRHNSPKGCAHTYSCVYDNKALKFSLRARARINYHRFSLGRIAKTKLFLEDFLYIPLGLLLRFKDKLGI